MTAAAFCSSLLKVGQLDICSAIRMWCNMKRQDEKAIVYLENSFPKPGNPSFLFSFDELLAPCKFLSMFLLLHSFKILFVVLWNLYPCRISTAVFVWCVILRFLVD